MEDIMSRDSIIRRLPLNNLGNLNRSQKDIPLSSHQNTYESNRRLKGSQEFDLRSRN